MFLHIYVFFPSILALRCVPFASGVALKISSDLPNNALYKHHWLTLTLTLVGHRVRRHESSGQGMYVIFPADELILMTYGIAIPRFKPRPTLDNLREPAVPFGPARHPKTPNATIPKAGASAKNALTSSAAAAAAVAPPTPTPKPTNTNSSPKSNGIAAASATTTTQTQKPPAGARRSITPSRSTANNNGASNTDDRISQHSRHSAGSAKALRQTDAFGYTSTTVTAPDAAAPQIFLEPPTPSVLSEVSPHFTSALPPTVPTKPATTRHKLHLHLPGRLGRSKQRANSPEPSRLRHVTDIHIHNPTFTSENLLQRNYDAFFESGEPVYSLEHRSASPQPATDETADVPSPTPSAGRTLGLFHRKAKAPQPPSVTSQTPSPPARKVQPDSAGAPSSRSRSVDRTMAADMPTQHKGGIMRLRSKRLAALRVLRSRFCVYII